MTVVVVRALGEWVVWFDAEMGPWIWDSDFRELRHDLRLGRKGWRLDWWLEVWDFWALFIFLFFFSSRILRSGLKTKVIFSIFCKLYDSSLKTFYENEIFINYKFVTLDFKQQQKTCDLTWIYKKGLESIPVSILIHHSVICHNSSTSSMLFYKRWTPDALTHFPNVVTWVSVT